MVLKKRLLALTLVGVMVLGSSITALAEDANGASGAGTNTGHLNQDVVTSVLPTTESVASIFNFTIDPEDILANADKFTDGTTAAGADFKNADLVYFKQAAGAEKGYDSTSQAVAVKAMNYVAADVKVVATIAEPADGKTIISMAESDAAFTEATDATLLLKLKVGDQTGVITADGATVTGSIAAQPTKFETKYVSANNYKLEPKADQEWAGVNVQLIGKVKKGTVTADTIAPNVTLTWTVAKHVESYVSATTISESAKELTLSLPTGVTVSSLTLTLNDSDVVLVSGNHYTIADSKLTVSKYAASWAGGTIKIKYSDNHEDVITCQ